MIEETIAAEQVVKAYGREQASIETFEKFNNRLKYAGTRAQFFGTLMPPLTFFVNNMGLVIVAFAGGYMAIQGDVTIGVIAAFYQLCAAVRTAFGPGCHFVQFDTVGTGRGRAGF